MQLRRHLRQRRTARSAAPSGHGGKAPRSAAAEANYSCGHIGHTILRRHPITGAVQRGNSVTHFVADATHNWWALTGWKSARRGLTRVQNLKPDLLREPNHHERKSN